ncbi:MAG: glycoside-pentoside-hexuronide (GPH):cation symporter [Treponema sp.]|jgi:GPH family glycoside/pentoside/hexuronide:cation symporter|nr:glycoside-pentoside-hexuronide (GPH):cation symporter [Treponema sp.]
MEEWKSKRLSVKQKLGFGIFDLGGNMFFTLMGFWSLKYLTDIVGVAAAWAGIAVMAGKVWDAVTDPVMGFISDRTLTRWGRRRPYLLAGAVPMMFAMWLFFSAPNIDKPVLLVLWVSLALMLLNTVSTVINIPYSSLTPELTGDYHERSSLNGYRFGCAVFGTILGAAAVQPIVDFFAGIGPGNIRFGWSMMGLSLGAVMTLVTLLTFFGVREKRHSAKDLPTKGFFATYRQVFSNRPYVILLLTYSLNIMGITFLQSILAYYTEYVYKRPDITPLAMMILLLTAMVCIPLSVMVSKRIGKKRTYQICFAVIASACMVIFLLGQRLGPNFFLIFMVYAGIGVGFGYVAPFAMVPDTVEYDAAKTGERKEGAYYGIWTFISKLGTSFSVFLSGLLLSIGGYVANAEQGGKAIFAITLLIGPVPALTLLGAMILIEKYTLDEKAYQELIAAAGKNNSA